MKAAKTLTLNENRPTQEQIRVLDLNMRKLFEVFKGRVRFGTGTDGDGGENISGIWQSITTNATPDSTETLAHGLGSIPIGYIVVNQDKAGSLYDQGTTWTTDNMYLSCDVASVTFTIFVLK